MVFHIDNLFIFVTDLISDKTLKQNKLLLK